MKQYHDLLRHVLATGTRKENRTGVDTISTCGYFYQHNLQEGFPLLTTKEVSWKNIVIELLWFLSGSDRSDLLEKHGCKFWRPWYNPDGTVKNCYGPAWRKFPVSPWNERLGAYTAPENDQIAWVVEELKRNPMSRRMVVSAWAPGVAQTAPLPPCHAMFVLNVQKSAEGDENLLCLNLLQRSADSFLGIPYNLASYSLLLHLFARFSGLKPWTFSHHMVDAHLYTKKATENFSEYDHVPLALEQLQRECRPLPKLTIDSSIQSLKDVEDLLGKSTDEVMSCFQLQGYNPHPAIRAKVAV